VLGKVIALLSIVLILASSAAVWGKEKEEERLKVGDPAPIFTLKDAYDKEHNLKLLLDNEDVKAIVLIMGDRKVRKDGNKWARELHKLYGKKKEIALIMIADLRDLPFFANEGMVKWGTKREKLPIPILMDWKGEVNQIYKTQKKKVDLFIINSDDKIAYSQVGKYSEKLVDKIKAKIEELLKEKEEA
jgi:hypothetical protein